MSTEDEFELNYVKLDGNNEIKLLGADDYAAEMSTFFSTVTEFDQEKISKKILKELEKNIPENSELLKTNIDFSKKFLKLINKDKKAINTSINRILSVEFKNQFIFSYSNLFDVSVILSLFFTEIKKYKIPSVDELKKRIKIIQLEKYNFFALYVNSNSIKSNKELNSFSYTNQSKSTDNSSMKDIKENNDMIFESEETSYNAKMYDLLFQKNIMNNLILNNGNSFFREEDHKKILTKDNFIYPNYNRIEKKEIKIGKNKLPIELMILLDKLEEVNCLIFQIQNIEGNFKKLAIFVLSNIFWLFKKHIKEIKFEIGNEIIQQGLDQTFESRAEELYKNHEININKYHYEGSYKARAVNCWVPEGDIFFTKRDKFKFNNQLVFNTQMTDELIILDDNHICKIYNEYGNETEYKYIIPVNYSLKNNLINNYEILLAKQKEQKNTSKYLDEEDINSTIDNINESISIFDLENLDIFDNRNSLNANSNNNNQINNESNNEFSNKSSTPYMLRNFVDKYKPYFKMILIYFDYISKSFKNINKLSLYFQTSFTYEMYLCFKTNLNFDLSHFLIFLNKIEKLKEINFSFNSLDDKSFEYILGILFKNTHLEILRLSFFTPDINYYDNALFNLCSAKSISLTKLFNEYNEYAKKNEENEEKKINDYILEEKLFNSLLINFVNLITLLKLQLIKNLKELVLRFDIPLPILKNQCYIILIIKFLMNILIMLSFQQNQTHTVKILAPNLELNCKQMPYIQSFFKEISLRDDVDKFEEIYKAEREKQKLKEIKRKSEKKGGNGLLNKINEIDQDIFTQIPQEKIEDYDIDINKNMENYDSSKGYKSMMEKSAKELPSTKRKSSGVLQNQIKSRKLNPNDTLEYLVMQMKILYLPEIFNICSINNLSGLKLINLGSLDEISFKGFVSDFRLYSNKLKSLITIKITLGFSVILYEDLEDYIYDYFNINTPKLEEKFLFSNLMIQNKDKMKELIELIYLKSITQKVILTINYNNINLLSKTLSKFINEYKAKNTNFINSLVLLMEHPKYQKLKNSETAKIISNLLKLNKRRMILCNENPDNTQ